MQTFNYTARDVSGELQRGILRGENQHQVLISLREKGLVPLKVEPVNAKSSKTKSRSKRITTSDLAAFCWQLAIMIEGGLAITTAIELIAEDIENKTLQQILTQMAEGLHRGEPLSECMEAHPRVFNHLFVSMVFAGETSGSLVKSLKKLGEFMDKRDKLIKKVKSAMAYPIIVLTVIVAVVTVIMAFIIPRFQTIFDQMGNELPAFTQAFMGFYDMVASNFIYGFVVFAVLVIGLIIYTRTDTGYSKLSTFLLRIPIIGKIISMSFVALFCATMSTLLGSGVSVLETLDIIGTLTKNTVIRKAIKRTRDNITSGASIYLSVGECGFFPNMVVKMLQVGEESGSLTNVLERTSEYYERKVDNLITVLMTALEPALIIIVGIIVGIVIVALYLPIFSMSDV